MTKRNATDPRKNHSGELFEIEKIWNILVQSGFRDFRPLLVLKSKYRDVLSFKTRYTHKCPVGTILIYLQGNYFRKKEVKLFLSLNFFYYSPEGSMIHRFLCLS